jgi:hypothetical protein
MAINVRISNSELFRKISIDRRNKLIIKFGDGVSKEKVEGFFNEHEWVRPDGKTVKVPGRNIFTQYLEENTAEVIRILKKSMALRFKKFNVKSQLEVAGMEIINDIVGYVYEGGLAPDNGQYWKSIKGDKPVGINTGEMIMSMEAEYVREP